MTAAASGGESLGNSRQVGVITGRPSSLLLLALVVQVLLSVAMAVATDALSQRGPGTAGSRDSSGHGSFIGDASAEDVGSVDDHEETPLFPDATRAEWLVTVGACSGVLIAPQFVLTSAGCTEQEESLEAGVVESVHFWLTKENGDATLSKTPIVREHQVDTTGGTLSTAAAVVGDHPAIQFVILELSKEAVVRPVLLETRDEIAGNENKEALSGPCAHVRLVGASQVQGDREEGQRFEVEARRVQQACESTREDFVCVVANATCEALLSVHGRRPIFLTTQSPNDDIQDVHLIGVSLTGSVSSCRNSEKPGSSVNEFIPLALLAEFIDLHSVGHMWTTPTGDDTNGSSDASSDNYDSVDVGEDFGNHQQLPKLLAGFPELGHLRVENRTGAVSFGAYVVLIAPRFVLTQARWLIEGGVTNSSHNPTALQVCFLTETIPVKSIVFQNELQNKGSGQYDEEDLAVLELEFEASIAAIRILATSLQLDIASPRIEVTVLDAASEPEEVEGRSLPMPDTIRDIALSFCPSSTMNKLALEFVCANAPPTNLNQGILRANDLLVGFSSSVLSKFPFTGSEVYERYQFTRLSSELHVQFLANATQSTALLIDEEHEEMIVEESEPDDDFPSFIVTFSTGGVHDKMIHCQGMLVAPKFVLTTASCALENPISEIRFHLPNGEMARAVHSPQMTIPHPRYNRSALSVDERFDIAILELEFATTVTPATLSLGGGLVNQTSDELISFQVAMKNSYLFDSASLYVSRVTLNRSAKCSVRGSRESGPVLSNRLQTPICLIPSWNSPEEKDDSLTSSSTPGFGSPGHNNGRRGKPDPAVGDSEAPHLPWGSEGDDVSLPLPSLNGSLIGKQLNNSRISMVGFAVAQELYDASGTDDDASEVYSITSVADFAVFINAYVVGASWESGGLTVDNPLQISKQYIVGLRVSKTGQNFCGGSLIAPSYVLTAAHCVTDGLANWVSVGSSSSSGGSTEAIPIIAKSTVIHHKYGSPSQFSFDAAIFELKSPAYANPVKLDRSRDFASGEKATMYGYGVQSQSTSKVKTLSTEIHAVDLSLLSQAQCKATLPDIDKSMLCAVGDNGGDACKGDSGGPLVVPESRTDQDVLVGFVSSGYDCGLKNVPGIYMRVSSLTEFIRDNTVGAAWSTAVVSKQPTVSPTPTLTPSTDSEFRDLDNLAPSKSPTSANGSSSDNGFGMTPSSTTSQSSKNAPIRAMDLPSDFKPQIRDAVLQYLLGITSDSGFFISSEFLERLAQEGNEIWFFSSGNLSNLLEILKRHNEKPLYARRDRFKRRKTGVDALRQDTSTIGRKNGVSDLTVCTP